MSRTSAPLRFRTDVIAEDRAARSPSKQKISALTYSAVPHCSPPSPGIATQSLMQTHQLVAVQNLAVLARKVKRYTKHFAIASTVLVFVGFLPNTAYA